MLSNIHMWKKKLHEAVLHHSVHGAWRPNLKLSVRKSANKKTTEYGWSKRHSKIFKLVYSKNNWTLQSMRFCIKNEDLIRIAKTTDLSTYIKNNSVTLYKRSLLRTTGTLQSERC